MQKETYLNDLRKYLPDGIRSGLCFAFISTAPMPAKSVDLQPLK